MIKVTREEAFEIRDKLKNVNVTMTNRHGNARKKTYYCEESYPVLKLLAEINSRKKIQHFE